MYAVKGKFRFLTSGTRGFEMTGFLTRHEFTIFDNSEDIRVLKLFSRGYPKSRKNYIVIPDLVRNPFYSIHMDSCFRACCTTNNNVIIDCNRENHFTRSKSNFF